ncbi:MAG: WbqC family protein [Pseudoflavonifractor sp.]|nr:WbqC family protein [Pseudoflavonifractor sp.]
MTGCPSSVLSPLVCFPDRTLLLSPAYCGSVDYYALMSAYPRVVVDYGMRFNKRHKETHRMSILGTGGVHSLTAPIVSRDGMSREPWSAVTLSTHGHWWHLHWGAIYSAYGRTPFFEFYRDDFEPLFQSPPLDLMAFNTRLDSVIRGIAGIDSEVTYSLHDELNTHTALGLDSASTVGHRPPSVDDYRTAPFPDFTTPTYYQVWSDKYGFTPGLSILDLIFNMGPESPLVLRDMTQCYFSD